MHPSETCSIYPVTGVSAVRKHKTSTIRLAASFDTGSGIKNVEDV